MKHLEEAVVKAAIIFCETEEAQESVAELEGSQSMSYPVEFMNLMDAVKQLKEKVKADGAGEVSV